jgi:hypothetical protein
VQQLSVAMFGSYYEKDPTLEASTEGQEAVDGRMPLSEIVSIAVKRHKTSVPPPVEEPGNRPIWS